MNCIRNSISCRASARAACSTRAVSHRWRRAVSPRKSTWQEARFKEPAAGRYLCLEALDAHDGGPRAVVAEFEALAADGAVVSKADWSIIWVSSEETVSEGGEAENVLDGQPATSWITSRNGPHPGYPHCLVIDLGAHTTLGGVRYLPRGGRPEDPGRIKDYRVYLSDTPFGLTPAP